MISILGDIQNLTAQVPEQLCTEQGTGLDVSIPWRTPGRETASEPGVCVRGRINQLPLHSCTSQFRAPRPSIMGSSTWLVALCQQVQEEQLKFCFRSPLKTLGQYLDSLHSWDISANLEPRNLSPIWLPHIFCFLSMGSCVLQKWPGFHLITLFRILHGNSRNRNA